MYYWSQLAAVFKYQEPFEPLKLGAAFKYRLPPRRR